jgi:hypothetical protein
MRKVDNDRWLNGSREYTLKIIEICDMVNCVSVNETYTHNVYANTKSFWTQSTSIDWHGIADWTINYTNIELLWRHWNQVVPASWINRTIDFNFNVINTLNQDQYTNSRNAVFVSESTKSNYSNRIWLWNKVTPLDNQKSTTWEYKFGFKIYAPTNNTDNKFEIKKIKVDINWTLWRNNVDLWNSDMKFDFDPLYTTKFSSNFDKLKSTFTQTWTIVLEKENGWNEVNVSWKSIFLTKDATLSNKKNSFNFEYTINWNVLKTLFTFIDRWNNYLDDFKTVFIQSWIKYKKDWKNIKYKSTSIWWNNDIINWVKILWRTNINENSQRDITRNQNSDDVHNLAWKIDKATLKRNIKRNAFKLTRWMTSNWNPINWIKYIDLSNASSPKELSSNYNWTIIVKWWDVYIRNNINVWWVIVLKNSNWKWWKLYIDPSVTEIQAAIYVDKSIVSYRNWELSSNSNYDLLKNQLYIYWAVFSENTIWGSFKTPPVCPYYVSSCTQEEAQKYDLNFLRSWYENNSATWENFPVIIKYNPSIQTNPPKGFSE